MFPCCYLTELKYLDEGEGEVVANDLEIAIKAAIKNYKLTKAEADQIRADPCRCECHRFGWVVMH